MPFVIASGFTYDIEEVTSKAVELEKRYDKSAVVQLALAKYFVKQKRFEDAIRCYQAAIGLDPAEGTFRSLAALYKSQENEEKWLATLEDYLKAEDFGLGHAQVQVEIADHFIAKDDWKTARPYADAAGQTWACWALLKAGECAEAMQDWTAAEQW